MKAKINVGIRKAAQFSNPSSFIRLKAAWSLLLLWRGGWLELGFNFNICMLEHYHFGILRGLKLPPLSVSNFIGVATHGPNPPEYVCLGCWRREF